MLSLFRSGWLRGFFLSFLVVGAVGLVLMDWQGVYGGRLAANDVARVGKETLTARDFDRTFRRVAQSQGLGVEDAYALGLGDVILQQELSRLLLAQAADDFGISPSRDLLTLELRTIAEKSRTPGDERPLSEILTALLQNNGLTETQLIDQLHAELASGLLQDTFLRNAPSFSPLVQEALARSAHQNRSFLAVTLHAHDFKTAATPTQETLEAYYQTVIGRFTTPEKRSGLIAFLDADALKKTIAVTDDDVKKYYDAHPNSFQRPERRTLEQVAVPTQEMAQKVADAFITTNNLKEALVTAGADTNALLPASSFARDDLPPALQEGVFSAPLGSLAGPIKGPFGWHLALIRAIDPPGTLSFAEVRESLRQKLIDDRFAQLIDDKMIAYDEGVESGTDFTALASAIGMTTTPFEGVERLQAGSSLADAIGNPQSAERLTRALFDLLPGESSPIMDIDGSLLVTVHLREKIDPAPKPFSSVSADVRTLWQQDQALKAMAKATEELVPFLMAEGLTIPDLARQYKKEPQRLTVKQSTTELHPSLHLPEGALETLRTMGLKEVRALNGPDSVTLIQMTDVQDGTQTAGATRKETVITPPILREILLRHFERVYPITINRAVLDQTYKPSMPERVGS